MCMWRHRCGCEGTDVIRTVRWWKFRYLWFNQGLAHTYHRWRKGDSRIVKGLAQVNSLDGDRTTIRVQISWVLVLCLCLTLPLPFDSSPFSLKHIFRAQKPVLSNCQELENRLELYLHFSCVGIQLDGLMKPLHQRWIGWSGRGALGAAVPFGSSLAQLSC